MIVNAKKHQALVIVKLTMLVKYIRNDYRFDSRISTVCKKIINVFNVMLRNSEKLETLEKRILPCTNEPIQDFLILLYKSLFFSQYPPYNTKNICLLFAIQPIICAAPTLSLSKPRTTTCRLHCIKCGRSCHRSGLRAILGGRDFCALSGYDQAEDVSACSDTGVSVLTREKYSGSRVVAGRPWVTNARPCKRRCAPWN